MLVAPPQMRSHVFRRRTRTFCFYGWAAVDQSVALRRGSCRAGPTLARRRGSPYWCLPPTPRWADISCRRAPHVRLTETYARDQPPAFFRLGTRRKADQAPGFPGARSTMFLAEAFVRPVLTLNPSSALPHFRRRFAGVFPRLTFPWCPNARNCQRVFRKRLDGEVAAAGLVVGRRVARLNGVNRQRPWPPGKHGWRLLAGGATVNARSAGRGERMLV
jgi:hypothetical protein